MNAPKSAPTNKINAGINSKPRIIKIGAAQAPEIPQPKPNRVPPKRVLIIPFFFGLGAILFPLISFIFPLLNNCIKTIEIKTALPITPNM